MSNKEFKQELILALAQNEAIVAAAGGKTSYSVSSALLANYINDLAERLSNG